MARRWTLLTGRRLRRWAESFGASGAADREKRVVVFNGPGGRHDSDGNGNCRLAVLLPRREGDPRRGRRGRRREAAGLDEGPARERASSASAPRHRRDIISSMARTKGRAPRHRRDVSHAHRSSGAAASRRPSPRRRSARGPSARACATAARTRATSRRTAARRRWRRCASSSRTRRAAAADARRRRARTPPRPSRPTSGAPMTTPRNDSRAASEHPSKNHQ